MNSDTNQCNCYYCAGNKLKYIQSLVCVIRREAIANIYLLEKLPPTFHEKKEY